MPRWWPAACWIIWNNTLDLTRHRQVATLQVLLGMMGTVRLLELIRKDMLSPALWRTGGLCALAVIPGAWIGVRLLETFSPRLFRHLVLGILLLTLFRSLAMSLTVPVS